MVVLLVLVVVLLVVRVLVLVLALVLLALVLVLVLVGNRTVSIMLVMASCGGMGGVSGVGGGYQRRIFIVNIAGQRYRQWTANTVSQNHTKERQQLAISN